MFTYRHSKKRVVLLMICIFVVSSTAFSQEKSICAEVRVNITQDAVRTREAFKATLEIDNNSEDSQINSFGVELSIIDEDGYDSIDFFLIQSPEIVNLGNVDGTGSLQTKTTGKVSWTIIPTHDAASNGAKRYFVGGTLTYKMDENNFTIPLFSDEITVHPIPFLVLDYFHQADVFADDPFTPEIEPSEPFYLGLMVRNHGAGIARNMRISSFQPKIVENEKGLLIDFQIIGTKIGTNAVSPSLTVDLGDIKPGQTTIAQWDLISSLQGKFTDYKASYEHLDDLGDQRVSAIDQVNIHDLIHIVSIDEPENDGIADFLVNDVTEDGLGLPETIYSSDGRLETVFSLLSAQVSEPVDLNNATEYQVSIEPPIGWFYLRINNPGADGTHLISVIRQDGKEILLENNAWTSRKTNHPSGQAAYIENYFHLVDHDGPGLYTLVFEDDSEILPTPTLPPFPETEATPTPTPTPIPIAYQVHVLDQKPQRVIQVSWDYDQLIGDRKDNHDYHVYVRNNDIDQYKYLGRTNVKSATSFIWRNDRPFLSTEFNSGPIPEEKYDFVVFPIFMNPSPEGKLLFSHTGPFNTQLVDDHIIRNEITETDADSNSHRAIYVEWEHILGTSSIAADYFEIWIQNDNATPALLGRTESNEHFFEWRPNSLLVTEEFKSGPEYKISYKFMVYAHDSFENALVGPFPSTGEIQILPSVTVSDDEEDLTDISGEVDIDPEDQRELVVHWNFDEHEFDTKDVLAYHVYVKVNDTPDYVYLGQAQGAESSQFIWKKQVKFTALPFQDGPTSGNQYQFKVFPLSLSGSPRIYGPYETVSSIQYFSF